MELSLDTGGRSAIFMSSVRGHYDVTKLLMQKGAEIDVKSTSGVTPLMCASFWGRCKVAKLLLETGANPNLQDLQGKSALMLASEKGHCDVVTQLLAHSAQLDAQDNDGNFSLHISVLEEMDKITALLLSRGADPSLKNKKKLSPFTMAILVGHHDTVQVFLDSQVLGTDKLLFALHVAVCRLKTEDGTTSDNDTIIEHLFKECLKVVERNRIIVGKS